jgi:DNA-binding NarL/FixJ family response regulator
MTGSTTARRHALLVGDDEHLVSDVLARVLIERGWDVSRTVAADRIDVTLLVNPVPQDWLNVEEIGRPIVLVDSKRREGRALVGALLAGADAVFDADCPPEPIADAVDVVAEGGTYLRPDQVRLLADAARSLETERHLPPIRLTSRETDILESIERGESVKQTALALGISSKTVENLQARLFRKLEARNRAQAVARAYELGLTAPAS